MVEVILQKGAHEVKSVDVSIDFHSKSDIEIFHVVGLILQLVIKKITC